MIDYSIGHDIQAPRVISPEFRAGGSGDEITIKKTVIFLIVKPIFCQKTAKTGLLESYDQEISGFLDRNPGRNVRVRSEESMRNLGRDTKRDVEGMSREMHNREIV